MGWQDVMAIGAVLAAGAYLASLVIRPLVGGKSASCGTGCGKCSAGGSAEPAQVVSIGGGPIASKSGADRP